MVESVELAGNFETGWKAMKAYVWLIFTLMIALSSSCFASERTLQLRDNLRRAKPGDYLVTAQNRNYTVMAIQKVSPRSVVIEEITVPFKSVRPGEDWKAWVLKGAPNHTCWVRFSVDLETGQLTEEISNSRQKQLQQAASQFLSTLLTLPFEQIPLNERRRVGPPPSSGSVDRRPFWQPKLLVEGHSLEGIRLEPFWAKWPKDGSELSGRMIEVFLPEKGQDYPDYFPYWLQISGLTGRAKIRIVDSGRGLLVTR